MDSEKGMEQKFKPLKESEKGMEPKKGFEVGEDSDDDESKLTLEQETRVRDMMAKDRDMSWNSAVNKVLKEDKDAEVDKE